MSVLAWFRADGWTSARPSGVHGMCVGWSLVALRTISNLTQQMISQG